MRIRIGNTRLRIGNVRLAIGSGSAAPAPTYASTFSVAISPSSGASGARLTVTVTPIGGVWPANAAIVGTYSGAGAVFANASTVAGSSAVVSFGATVTASGGTTGMVNATISGLTSTGGQTYTATGQTVTPPPPTGQVTKAELIAGKSAVSPGTPVSFRIVPNGNWAGQALALGIAKGSGTLSTTTLTAPSSGNTTLTFTYTPSSLGEHAVTLSGNGLYSPWPHPLNCFSTSNGSPQTFAANLVLDDLAPHQFDVWGAKPFGFDSMDCNAWGEVPLLPSTSGPALFARLYDCLSSGATSTAGTGTPLHSAPVQVYGAFTAGNPIIPLLPGSRSIYFADFATDAAFTNPIRLAKRFSVGLVIAANQRSYECGIGRAYGYSGTGVATGQTYAKAVANSTFDVRYGAATNWFRHDGVSANNDQYAYGEASSAATQRMGELVDHYFAVTTGITGANIAGGGIDSHINHDGSPCSGFVDTVASKVRKKFRWLWLNNVNWDAVDSNYPDAVTNNEGLNRILSNVDFMMQNYPACSVVGMGYAGNSYDVDGSALAVNQNFPAGAARFVLQIVGALGAHVHLKTAVGAVNGNQPVGHPGHSSRASYTEIGFRAFYAGELAAFGGLQTNQTGPVLAASGTRSGNTVYMPFIQQGGASVVSHAVSFDPNDPTRNFQTATPAELASIFAIWSGGNGCALDSGSTNVKIDGVTIDNANSQFIIALTPGQTLASQLKLHLNTDFGVSNTTLQAANPYRAAFLTDDRTDASIGLQYGWTMPPSIDRLVTVS